MRAAAVKSGKGFPGKRTGKQQSQPQARRERNGAHAQLVRCVAVDGGDNPGLIALVETEHIGVQKENRHGSFGLAPIGAFQGFSLGAICLHCSQPGVEQRVFR